MANVSGRAAGTTIPPRYVGILKIAVAIMTALLIAGIVALAVGVARQASKLGTQPKPAVASAGQTPYTRLLDLGQGKLETITAGGDLLILHWKGEGSDLLLSIDPRNGHELGRIQLPRH